MEAELSNFGLQATTTEATHLEYFGYLGLGGVHWFTKMLKIFPPYVNHLTAEVLDILIFEIGEEKLIFLHNIQTLQIVGTHQLK